MPRSGLGNSLKMIAYSCGLSEMAEARRFTTVLISRSPLINNLHYHTVAPLRGLNTDGTVSWKVRDRIPIE